MTEKKQIEVCLKEIEKQLQWSPSAKWTDYDFKKLNKLIVEKSKIDISPQTLKRLFGKIEYKSNYRPQIATKNGLAIFLGYLNWADYEKNYFESKKARGIVIKIKQGARKYLFTILLAFVFFGIIYLAFTKIFHQKEPAVTYQFEVSNPAGKVPHTASFFYDVEKNISDNVFIDFNYAHPVMGYQKQSVIKKNSTINHCFQIPGIYRTKLWVGNRELKTQTIQAKSDGWVCIFNEEQNVEKIQINNHIQTYYKISLSNVFSVSDNEGRFYISKKKLHEKGFDTTSVFYLNYRNIKEYNISGDSFVFRAQLKNSKETGGISCYDIRVVLYGKKDNFSVLLVEPGCHRWASVWASENKRSGEQYNLVGLSLNMSDFFDLKIENRNKTFGIYANDSLIYTGSYQKAIGEIIGVDVMFKGTGEIKNLELKPQSDYS